ncbi:MAG: MFS transporter [Propionibacteriaceae bacterium]
MTTIDPTPYRTEAPAPRAGVREWLALGVLMLSVLLVSVDNTVLSFALPMISVALQPSGAQLLWIVDVYPLMLATLLVAMGSLGDRIGRRRLLMIGATGFGAVSALAAFAPSAEMLITARALQGLFGATLMPSTLSLLRNIFHDAGQRRLAIAAWGGMFSGGAALGPILGGWLLEHFWWGSVFLINIPVVVVLLGTALWVVPESKDPRPGAIDVVSIALSMATMLPIVYGIKRAATERFDLTVLGVLLVGATAGVLFVRRQQRAKDPMLDVALFRNRFFSGAVLSNLLSMAGFAGFIFFAAQFLQLVAGLSPMQAAVALLPGLVMTVLAGFLAVAVVAKVGVRWLVSGSFLLAAIGYAVVGAPGAVPTLWTVAIGFAVLGVGIGIAETLTNDVVLTVVPPHRAGSASAISETAYEVGALLGTAVLGSVLTATFRSRLDPPATVLEQSDPTSLETLGGALEEAARYPAAVADQLVESAHLAFDAGVQATAIAAILLSLAAAVVAHRTLRGR